jgi:hypothetical protein
MGTFKNAEVIVKDFGNWCEAVGGARSIGHDVHLGVVLLVVHSVDEGGAALVL